MIAVAVAGGALLLATAAALVIVLIKDSSTHVKVAKTALVTNGYSPRLSSTVTPVVEANRTLSNALVALDGSQRTIRESRTATTEAQQVLTDARGALGVLAVPQSYTQLSQQATQALTQENGYLQAVSTTLDDPTGNTVASLQPLASATSSTFVPLGSVATGGNVSIFGVDNLLKWTQGANARKERHAPKPTTTVIAPTTTNIVPPSPAPAVSDPAPASSSLTSCDQNIQADPQTTTCPLAENTFVAYYNSGSTSSGWGDAAVSAYGAKTGETYDMSCTTDQTTVSCTGTAGSSPLFVTFPMQAVEIDYSPPAAWIGAAVLSWLLPSAFGSSTRSRTRGSAAFCWGGFVRWWFAAAGWGLPPVCLSDRIGSCVCLVRPRIAITGSPVRASLPGSAGSCWSRRVVAGGAMTRWRGCVETVTCSSWKIPGGWSV